MQKLLLFLCASFLLFSCTKNVAKTESNDFEYSVFTDSIPKAKKRVKLIKLKSAVKKNIEESPSYGIVEEYIDSLNTCPFSKVEEITSILKDQIDEVSTEIPEDLKTNGVLSRLNQIRNYCLKTEFTMVSRVVDTNMLNKNILQVLTSYNTLVIQLNETQAKLPKEIEEQLKKGKQIKKDTIEGTPLF